MFIYDDDVNNPNLINNENLADDIFHMIVGIRDNDALGLGHDEFRLWVDDTKVASRDEGNFGICDLPSTLYVGAYSGASEFIGKIDEIWIIKGIGQSDAWVLTVFNKQNSPQSFYVFGPEETTN